MTKKYVTYDFQMANIWFIVKGIHELSLLFEWGDENKHGSHQNHTLVLFYDEIGLLQMYYVIELMPRRNSLTI